ncbi:Murein DD-endopeptidase MepM [Leptolyngbya sp. O-77]|nr:Murein DD-endopeptidase MepM [Leptolyngbya sp. O-77]
MRRAFPQKVKPVSCYSSDYAAEAGQPKQNPREVSRKARTSAAMLGLALSMGASSLLLPRHSDQATAAEPNSVESEVSTGLSVPQTSSLDSPLASPGIDEVDPTALSAPVKASSSSTYSGAMFTHRVRSGQTLYKIARYYRVPVRTLAEVNGLSLDSVLRVGQAIRVPGHRRAESASVLGVAPERTPQPIPSVEPSPLAADTPASSSVGVLAEQTAPSEVAAISEEIRTSDRPLRYASLENLRQRRERLRSVLTSQQLQSAVEPSSLSKDDTTPSVRIQGSDQSGPLGAGEKQSVSPPSSNGLAASGYGERSLTAVLPAGGSVLYRVKPGDTLGAIALAYDVPQSVLVAANDLDNPHQLQVNQVLAVPSGSATLESSSNALSQPAGDVSLNPEQPVLLAHRVSAGETIEQIASAYGVSKDAVVEASGLQDPDVIQIGQVIAVPAESSELVSSARRQSSVVLPPADSRQVGEASTVFEPSDSVPTLATGSSVLFATEFVGVGGVAPARSEAVRSEVDRPGTTEVAAVVLPAQNPSRTYEHLHRLINDVATLRSSEPSEGSSLDNQTSKFAQDNQPSVVAALNLRSVGSAQDLGDRFVPSVPTVEPVLEARPGATQPEPEVVSELDAGEFAVKPGALDSSNPSASAEPELVAAAPASESAPAASSGQLVAVAPLGSESYEPLLEPLVGRMVSPELPALSQMDAFLPEGTSVSNGFIWPARGVLTSGFGWRWGRMHRGIDIAAPVGTPIVAAAAGVVEFSGWNSGGYGYMIDIRHADGTRTRYAHNSRLLVRVGDRVDQGQHIAAMGSTGFSTGPHVHFEIHVPNQGTVNPMSLLARR